MNQFLKGRKPNLWARPWVGISFHCFHLSSTPSYWGRSDSYWCPYPRNRNRSFHRLLLAQQMMYSSNSPRFTRGTEASMTGVLLEGTGTGMGSLGKISCYLGSWSGSLHPSAGLCHSSPEMARAGSSDLSGLSKLLGWSISHFSHFQCYGDACIPTHKWQCNSN